MRNFITRHPVLFAIVMTLVNLGLGLLAFLLSKLFGFPEPVTIIVALLFSTALPLAFIWWLHWWEDAGFVGATQNAQVLWFPLVIMVLPILVFGAAELEVGMVRLFVVALFLTGLSEEAMSRGLLLRTLLPLGKWYAVLVTAVLFGLGHITQFLFLGLPLTDNLLQIADTIAFGIFFAAVRLRIGSIWPLIIIHMFEDVFHVLSGSVPGAILEMPIVIKIVVAVLQVAYAIYILRKPNVVSISSDVKG